MGASLTPGNSLHKLLVIEFHVLSIGPLLLFVTLQEAGALSFRALDVFLEFFLVELYGIFAGGLLVLLAALMFDHA